MRIKGVFASQSLLQPDLAGGRHKPKGVGVSDSCGTSKHQQELQCFAALVEGLYLAAEGKNTWSKPRSKV